MTIDGPTPVELFQGDVDYNHYIEKQIRPIADGVLFAAGEDFDSIIEGRQLNLF
jgi:DNA polymerase-2